MKQNPYLDRRGRFVLHTDPAGEGQRKSGSSEGPGGSSLLKRKAGSSCAHQKEARHTRLKGVLKLVVSWPKPYIILYFESLGTPNVLCLS